MGQKVNPHGLRVGVIKDWDSRWFAKDEEFGDTLVSDYKTLYKGKCCGATEASAYNKGVVKNGNK